MALGRSAKQIISISYVVPPCIIKYFTNYKIDSIINIFEILNIANIIQHLNLLLHLNGSMSGYFLLFLILILFKVANEIWTFAC